ncbi:hypothetical protein DPEC_G00272220 [Dallia pectoralis]|uniref:Uncharacterized protein n=1 Tax=Dallia pectoralis TaxID=75939 RepID=A0ACC2FQ71_DALPE|nr:hypothetical protein DPEC_G00272220 [Dallia pectoralis]
MNKIKASLGRILTCVPGVVRSPVASLSGRDIDTDNVNYGSHRLLPREQRRYTFNEAPHKQRRGWWVSDVQVPLVLLFALLEPFHNTVSSRSGIRYASHVRGVSRNGCRPRTNCICRAHEAARLSQ